MIHFALLFSKQGKIRLSKYYEPYSQASRLKLQRDVMESRHPTSVSLVQRRRLQNVQVGVQTIRVSLLRLRGRRDDNVLLALEKIQRFVEILDGYFGNVCELDLITNSQRRITSWTKSSSPERCKKSSKRLVARLVNEQDALVEQMKVQDE